VTCGCLQRVIGSAAYDSARNSLQRGTLEDGTLWVGPYHGGMTADKVEHKRCYEYAASHNRAREEKIYVDKTLLRATGNIPAFKSEDEVYVGRWLNGYSDFDLKRIRIYPMLSDDEVKNL